jgi:hypothetical protein
VSTFDGFLSNLLSPKQNLMSNTGLPDTSKPDDITTYSINDILKSGKFTAEERKREYRRRGKSPSGVIDGVHNDAYRGNDDEYNDSLRDWEAGTLQQSTWSSSLNTALHMKQGITTCNCCPKIFDL